MEFSARQKKIINIVRENQPITSQGIAEKLGLTRAAIRADLSVLTMAEILEAKPRVGYFYIESFRSLGAWDRFFNKTVREIQSVPVVINEETSVYDAVVTLFLEDVGTLFVVNGESYLVGVVSRKDLLKITLESQDSSRIPVSVIMTRRPQIVTAAPDETIYSAARKIISAQVDALPVLNLQEKIVGRLSKTNLVRALVDFGSKGEEI